jgi:hypothetical protein
MLAHGPLDRWFRDAHDEYPVKSGRGATILLPAGDRDPIARPCKCQKYVRIY